MVRFFCDDSSGGNEREEKMEGEDRSNHVMASRVVSSPPQLSLLLPVARVWSPRLAAVCCFLLPEIGMWRESMKMKVRHGYNLNRNVDCEYRLKICSHR